jgi:hypothetical protein
MKANPAMQQCSLMMFDVTNAGEKVPPFSLADADRSPFNFPRSMRTTGLSIRACPTMMPDLPGFIRGSSSRESGTLSHEFS